MSLKGLSNASIRKAMDLSVNVRKD